MKFLVLLLILLSSISLYYFWPSKTQENILKIGMMSGWAPFMSVNRHGDFEGFDVDVANEIAKRLGTNSKIIDMGSLSSLFVALDRNKIDLALSGLDITQERLEKLAMTAYVGEHTPEYKLLFWQKIPDFITKLEDLKLDKNPIVLVEPGVSAEKYIKNYDFISTKALASLAERLLDLEYGKSLAMLVEPHIASMLMAKKPELVALSVPLPPEFQIYGMGIASKKSNHVLNQKISAVIASMKEDGTLENLERKAGLKAYEF